MKRKSTRLFWLIQLTLIVALVTGSLAPIGQAMNEGTRKARAPRTTEQRLETVALRFGENPLLPVLMHAMERYVKGTPAESDIDRAFRGALLRHPNVNAQRLQPIVERWKAVPESTKAKLVPADLRGLNFTRKLDAAQVAPAMRRYAPPPAGGTYVATAREKAPLIRNVFGSSTAANAQDADGYPRIYLGSGFMIDAENVGADKNKIKIHVLKPGSFGNPEKEVAAITPAGAFLNANGVTTITVQAMPNIEFGDYKVAVEVVGVGTSDRRWVDVTLPNQNLPSAIKSFEPKTQYPGGAVTMTGLNIPGSAKLLWKRADATDQTATPVAISATGTAQADFTIPQTITPGKYFLSLVAGGVKVSKETAFTVRAPLYRVKFTQIKCIGMTGSAGEDEIVTTWIVDADGRAFEKHTGVYEHFVDNAPPRNYLPGDSTVFPRTGNQGGEVRDHLAIATSLTEWDAGDVEAATQALDAIGTAAMSIGELFGGVGAIVGAVVEIVMKFIGALVSLFGGDPDPLGVQTVSLTAADLQKKTTKGSFSDTVQFADYKDDSYHYMLNYTVTREQPQ
ncbi:MAG TPA: hypothetical protein VKA60_15600 [Blastocatellia bacterium]|nr:hypothetical protein [Blastocatellia bacterium]